MDGSPAAVTSGARWGSCLLLALLLFGSGGGGGQTAAEQEPKPDPSTGDVADAVVGDGADAADAAARPEPDPIDRLVEQGYNARRRGQIDMAVNAYTAARHLAPSRYDVRILLADTLRRTNRIQEAAKEYRAAMKLDPARPEAYPGQAMIQWAGFNHAGAAAIVEHGIEQVVPERSGTLWMNLAETHRRWGNLPRAAELFNKAIEIDPSLALARAGLARVAEQDGDIGLALRHWNRYLELEPADESAGLRRQELLDLEAAVAALEAAIETTPGADLHTELGRLLAIAGDLSGAVAAYRRALKLEPDRIDATRGLAIALRRRDDLAAASSEFRRLLTIRPSDGVALYNLAAIAGSTRNSGAEEAAWTQLLEARPDDLFAAHAFLQFLARQGDGARDRVIEQIEGETIATRRFRAQLFAAAGRWDESEADLYAALNGDPSDPRTITVTQEILNLHPAMLGRLAARAGKAAGDSAGPAPLLLMTRLTALAGRMDDALRLAKQGVVAAPGSAVAGSMLAEMNQSAPGDLDGTLRELRRTVELDPARLIGHVDLAMTLLRVGRTEDAVKAAYRGLENNPDAPELLSILGGALAQQGDLEGAARAYRDSLHADPVDQIGLSRSQYPMVLAALGRNVEARHALEGEIAPIPEVLYLEAWRFVRDSHLDRTFNGQDWDHWKDLYLGKLFSAHDAHQAIATMLASLGDPYTRLRGPEETAAMFLSRHGEGVAVDGLGGKRPHSKTVVSRALPGGRGYIQLNNLTDPKAVAEMRRALERLGEADEIILDLRGNKGGLNRPADAIGDLIAGPGKDAGVDEERGDRRARLTGGAGALTESPITVLVDGQTASAAERLARTLEATGRGTIVGEPTFGKGRYQVPLVLPGGVTVLVSIGQMLDRAGRPIQGRGLRPGKRNGNGSKAGERSRHQEQDQPVP